MRTVIGTIRAVFFILTGVAVLANFTRSASIDFSADSEPSGAYAAQERAFSGDKPEKRKCPCPAELENADCDEGLCSAGLAYDSFPYSYPFTDGRLIAALRSARAQSLKPDPQPPRVVA